MGGTTSSPIPDTPNIGPLLRQTQEFAKWTLKDIEKLKVHFDKIHGFALSQSDLESLLSCQPLVDTTTAALFQVLDFNKDGRIDGMGFLGALTLCCKGVFEEKARFSFELYDLNLNGSLSNAELTLMMHSLYIGMLSFTHFNGSLPPVNHLIPLTLDAFSHSGKPIQESLTFNEFIQWARSHRSIMQFIETCQQLCLNSINPEDPEIPALEGSDDDSDIEVEMEYPEHLKKIDSSTVTNGSTFENTYLSLDDQSAFINGDLPNANLSLEWVYGYRSFDTRNNLRYTVYGDIVYFAANMGIIYNKRRLQQRYYQGHSGEIVSMAIHPSRDKVATGQLGLHPEIHIWSIISLECITILKDFHQYGVSLLEFSRNGNRLVSVGMDRDRSIGVWDWNTSKLAASGKGSSNKILGCALSTDGTELVLCGVKVIKFFAIQDRTMKGKNANIGEKGRLQVFLCATYMENNVFVGTASGHIYKFSGDQLVLSVQAHSIHESVTSFYTKENILISGGKDGLIRLWDSNLRIIGNTLDIGKDMKGLEGEVNSCQPRIVSVCMMENKILAGTRGSEIFEIDLNSKQTEKLMDGHYQGHLKGLASSLVKAEFATCGDDKTVRKWSIRKKKLLRMKRIQSEGHCLCFSSTGKEVAVGCQDGSVYIMDASLKQVYLHFQHTHDPIVDIKYSPNGKYLGYCNKTGIIFLYDVVETSSSHRLTRKTICYSPDEIITHLDFSINSEYLKTHCKQGLRYWNVSLGALVTSPEWIQDMEWSTSTVLSGWDKKGIQDVTSVCCAPDQQLLVGTYPNGEVKLFHYPCLSNTPMDKSYKVHGIHVSNCCFSINNSILLTTGFNDRCIFQWRVELEEKDEQKVHLSKVEQQMTSLKTDNAYDSWKIHVDHQRTNSPVHPSFPVAPLPPIPPISSMDSRYATDVDIEIQWIFGLSNSVYLKNHVKYDISGNIIYPAAAVGVVYNAFGHKQSFEKSHKDEILSIAMHESGKLFATGSFGKEPTIVIWNSETLEVSSVIKTDHEHGISHLAFNGDLLASIGLDVYHSLELYLWKKKVRIAKAKGNKKKILACGYHDADPRFITCGVDHITFWTINGQNIKSHKGIFGRNAKIQTLISITSLHNNTITGAEDGSLIIWDGHYAIGEIKVHPASVECLFATESGFMSGGKDGLLCFWQSKTNPKYQGEIELSHTFNLSKVFKTGLPHLSSICSQDGKILVTTTSNEMVELVESLISPNGNIPENAIKTIHSSHFSGEMGDLAVHPNKEMFCSCGDDMTLRLWDYNRKVMIKMSLLQDKGKSIAYSPIPIGVDEGKTFHIAVGLGNGTLCVVGEKDLSVISTNQDSKYSIADCKYSPCGTLFAMGSYDGNIYIYQVKETQYQLTQVYSGHHGAVNRLDFSIDSSILQSTSSNLELFYWNVAKGEQMNASLVQEVQWNTMTCLCGWHLAGILSRSTGEPSITSVDRCRGQWLEGDQDKTKIWSCLVPVLAVGDDQGLLKLHRHPCISHHSSEKTYYGHSSAISTVSFTNDDGYLLTCGVRDKCIILWKTDCIEEVKMRESQMLSNLPLEKQIGSLTTDNKMMTPLPLKEEPNIIQQPNLFQEPNFYQAVASKENTGDEFLAVKPWIGAIREPTNYKELSNSSAVPDATLELQFIHGYRTTDCRNNVHYAADNKEIIYFAAATGIVYNSITHTQRCYVAHTDDIISISVHPQGHTVATGEIGKKPKIFLWDPNSCSTLVTLVGFHQQGVAHLSFNSAGDKLASVGLDKDHSVAIYTLDGTCIGTSKGGQQKVLGLAFGEDELVTVGIKHISFWNFCRNSLSSKKGIFGKKGDPTQSISSVIYMGSEVVTAQGDGSIYVWKGRNCSISKKVHKGAVNCLFRLIESSGFVSGGKDGKIIVWNRQVEPLSIVDMNRVSPTSIKPSLNSVCLNGGKILAGTQGSEIYELDISKITNDKLEAKRYIQGHYDGELWAMQVHPSNQEYVTAGDDATVRVWDVPNRRMLHLAEIGIKARAICYSPDGGHIALGLYNGNVKVYSSDLTRILFDAPCAKRWIQCIKYSPDGKTLVVGSHDQMIYLLNAPMYAKRVICKGHSSYITHLDFSSDSKYLQSNCGAYELLFWNVDNGKQIKSAMEMRDVKWSTWTCTLGWPVQGIWPECSDGTDINAVHRNQTGTLLVSADDHGKLKLFNYPSTKPKANFKVYSGHSSHITNCMFTKDDRCVISVGGNDKCIFQFKCNLST